MTRKELLWTGLLFALVTIIPAAVFWNELPCSDDTLPHFYRTIQLDTHIQQGTPFLQWGTDMLRGYGYTIFLFYAPLAYWLLEAIHLLGFDFGPAMQITFVLALWLAGWGGYTLARNFIQPLGSFIAGLGYLFAPYILYDAIQRGALPETLALALVPWALAASLRALDNPHPRHIFLAVILFVILILTHNVVPIFALGLLVLFALASLEWSSPTTQLKTLVPPLLILGLALGLTLFFWLPGLVELQYTQSRQPNPPFKQWPRYDQHIIPVHELMVMPDDPADPNLMNPPIPRTLGIGQMLLGLAGMIALVWYQQALAKRRLVLLAMTTIAAIFFSSQWSFWSWEHLPLLNFIQLPSRFLGLASLGLAIFSGVAVQQLHNWLSEKWQTAVTTFLAALIVSISGWAWLYPHYCAVPQNANQMTLTQATTWNRWYAEAQAETLPRWIQEFPPEDALISQYETNENINRLILPDGVTLLDWQSKPAQDTYQLLLRAPSKLTYQSFYFPGWQAKIDGEVVEITPTDANGLMAIEVPAGEHTLAIKFGPTPLRIFTLFISTLVTIGLIIWVLRAPKPIKSENAENSYTSFKEVLPLLLLTAVFLIGTKFIIIDRISTPIRADRLQGGQLSNVQYPTAVNFGEEFLHLGYKGDTQFDADEIIHLTQYWTPQRGIGVPYGFDLQVVDETGQVWHTAPGRPFSYTQFPGTESWEVGQYARDAYAIELLPGTPPGTYWLEATAFRRDIDQALIPQSDNRGSSPDRLRLGAIQLNPGSWQLDGQKAQIETFQPTPINAESGLKLVGWTLPDIVWRSGETATADLLWQGENLAVIKLLTATLWLQDASGNRVAEKHIMPGGDAYPIKDWPQTTVVRDKIAWRIPPQVESGTYRVNITIADQDIALGQWQIEAPPRTFTQPQFSNPTDFSVDFARLVGFDLSDTAVPPNTPVELSLIWQVTAATDTNYRVFVHLRDEQGNLVTQSDAIPDHWTRPTIGWLPDEYIPDRHTLTIPEGTPAGEHQLIVGLYEPTTGTRLGEVNLGNITITE